ncbi:MAG: hypothetical protein BRD50_03590 [Bacteroidetes bacterium SW_11_45_7]|nr:MAG: hypothetical protein BRD50_03590 [Bacteroidetes bacterium SW_11_45_7]
MLSLSEIQKFYPETLHHAGDFLIREFLQYKMLEIIYESDYADGLIFMGGTCLRIIHGNNRFSEDLDFDNLNLGEEDFSKVGDIIQARLEKEGYDVDVSVLHKRAFHCYVRFPGLLFREGLSGHKTQKILIQLDTEPQNFGYQPEQVLLNKFDVFTEVLTTPLSIMLAQKYFAVLNRIRNKGRDFYDIVFLHSMQTEPEWQYLNQKLGISTKKELKEAVLQHCEKLNMEKMAKDVEPFLFRSKDAQKVTRFTKLIRQVL